MLQPEFTAADRAEVQRLNGKLGKLPRFRMKTLLGRTALNVLLRAAEIYPLIRRKKTTARRTLRVVTSSGHTIKLRIFNPAGVVWGLVMDYHGGGWTIGNARMDDAQNASMAERLSVTVVSVDYRLALNRAITEVAEQCAAAALWTLEHAQSEFGAERIIVRGSSAGAHLAAAGLLRLRDKGLLTPSVCGVLLYFGLYDFTGTDMVREAGHDVVLLDAPTVRTTLCQLTPKMTDEQRKSPAISPLYADLKRLPPALFVVGTQDMLLEDNRLMEAAWREANGNSELLIAPECSHAFTRQDTVTASRVEAYADAWILARLN